MTHTIRSLVSRVFLGSLFGFLCFSSIAAAATTITPVSIQGDVKVLPEKSQDWQVLSEATSIEAGDEILTGENSSADLLCEDGSQLHLGEKTQIAISELDYSMPRDTRNYRFLVFAGIVTVEAEPSTFQHNLFEVKTDTVLTSFKGSKLTILANQHSDQDTDSSTTLIPIEGTFLLRQIGDGSTIVDCQLLDGEGGLNFGLRPEALVELEIDQTPGRERIRIKSDVTLPDMFALLSKIHNTLQVNTSEKVSLLSILFGANSATLGPNVQAIFGLPLTFLRKELQITSEGIDTEFLFGEQPDIPEGEMYVHVEQGSVLINNQKISSGTTTYFSLLVPPPEDEDEDTNDIPLEPPSGEQEIPVAPPAPERPPVEGTGSPIFPE